MRRSGQRTRCWGSCAACCRRSIGALTLDYAPERFHARLSAVEKTYVYRLWNSDRPDVFARRYRAWEPRPLDCGAMRAGAAGLVGTHDFLRSAPTGR